MAKVFSNYLRAETARVAKREGISIDKAFLHWFGTTILDISDDEAREAISIEGANDKGIDLFWVDEEEGRVFIVQGKYAPDLGYRPKIGEVTKLESSVNWLTNPEALRRDGKTDLAQAADDYLEAVKSGYGVELWFVYTGPKCANVDKHISVYTQNPENAEKRRAARHYHLDLLRATWEELEGVARRIPQDVIVVPDGKFLPFDGRFGKALVASVPAEEIARLHARYEDSLFDRNVRLFLGVRKGSVNAGIAETLKDKSDSLNFWAYNNGITVICDDFIPGATQVELKNFSIVNGCQTAVSLAHGPEENLKKISVLVRFIAASPAIVDDVIRFTNSQNPIRTWDIASQDRTQRRLKSGLDLLKRPFIYLTRRGSRPRGDLKRYRQNGKLRQIRIDSMGQYAAASRGKAILAYKDKALIFSKHHDEVFPPDVRVEEVLFQWVCGEIVRETVQGAMRKESEEAIRILRKGGTLFILALMSNILSVRNGATYLSKCTEDSILSKGTAIRLKKYAEYAKDAYVQAVLDQSQLEKEELATLIRQSDFHNKVVDRVLRQYKKDARAAQWVKEALPAIIFSKV